MSRHWPSINPGSHPGFDPNQGVTPTKQPDPWGYGEPDPEPLPIRRPRWNPRTVATLALITAILVTIGALTLTGLRHAQRPPAVPIVPVTPAVATDSRADLAVYTRYVVEGTGQADITYSTLDGQQTEFNVVLPWSTELDAVVPMIEAVSRSTSSSTITCRVAQYGSDVKTVTSRGSHASCTAVGPVG